MNELLAALAHLIDEHGVFIIAMGFLFGGSILDGIGHAIGRRGDNKAKIELKATKMELKAAKAENSRLTRQVFSLQKSLANVSAGVQNQDVSGLASQLTEAQLTNNQLLMLLMRVHDQDEVIPQLGTDLSADIKRVVTYYKQPLLPSQDPKAIRDR